MRSSGFSTETSSTAPGIVFGIVVLVTLTAVPAAGTAVQAAQEPVDAESVGEEATAEKTPVSEEHRRIVDSAGAIAQDDSHGGSVGDEVDIDLSVPDGASGRLFLGSDEKAYLTSVAFTDDGDGEVTLSLNTYLAGGHLGAERRAWSADSGRITNVTRHTDPLSDPLEPAIYDVNLTVDGSERAVTPLPLRPASVDGATTAVAPADEFGDQPTDLTATRTDRIANGDTLLANVTAAGVFGMVAAQSGESTTARFRSLVTGENASLEIRPETVDADLALDRSFENDAFDIYTDPDAETLSIVMDTGALRYDGDASEIEDGERYTLVFWIEEESELTVDETTVGVGVEVRERTARFETGENGTVQLASVPDAELSGTTTLAPGTEFEVEARAAGVFLRRNETQVGENGTFTAGLNLSAVAPGTAFTASIDALDVETDGVVTNATDRDAATDRGTPTEQRGATGTTETGANDGNVVPAAAADRPAAPTESTPANRSATTTGESGAGFGALAALLAVVTLAGLTLGRRRFADS